LEKISHTQTEKQLSPPTSESRLDNPNLFEGDIALQTGSPVPGATPSAVFDSQIWPTKKIPYVITANVFSMIVYLFYDSLFLFFKTLLSHVFSPKPSHFNFGRYESI